MKLSQQTKITARSAKRLGRGLGSGKGKTSGRGTKGQKARGKIPAANVGAGLIYYKKLPYKRGWGNNKVSSKPIVVTLNDLNILKPNTVVNLSTLIEAGVVKQTQAKDRTVKILGNGELKVALTVEVPVSSNARKSIEQVGGKVV